MVKQIQNITLTLNMDDDVVSKVSVPTYVLTNKQVEQIRNNPSEFLQDLYQKMLQNLKERYMSE